MNKKEEAKRLWETCFDDNPLFTELYFQKRYTDSNTITITNGDKLLSVMQLLSYPFVFFNSVLSSAYVSGACTDPLFRDQGLMKRLLHKALNHLDQQKTPICTLIPAHDWLFDYYAKSGFETVFYKETIEGVVCTNQTTQTDLQVNIEDEYSSRTHNYLDKKNLEQQAAILHTKEDYFVVLADLKLAEGKVFVASHKNIVVGVAIAYLNSQNKTVYFNEILSDTIEIQNHLIQATCTFFGTKTYALTRPSPKGSGNKMGMLRVIDAPTMLELYAAENPTFSKHFILTDPIIKKNEGEYLIENGGVTLLKSKPVPAIEKLSINQLTSLLFQQTTPYMSLMLD